MALTLREPVSTFDLSMQDGAVLRVRQHGEIGGPRLVLSHGNGLASDGYLPFWEPLCARWEVVLVDVRNHGQNPTHELSGHHWDNFADDMEILRLRLEAELGRKPAVGVFHSLSAIASLEHALRYGAAWEALVLVDPPIAPPEGHPLRQDHIDDMTDMTSRASRRPARYRSPGMLEFQLRAGREFQGWVEGAHRLLAETTLRYDEDADDYALACPREFEAHVFASNMDPTTWERASAIEMPVLVLGADPDFALARPASRIGRVLAEAHDWAYACVPGTSHFLQIEQPEAAIAAIEDFLETLGPTVGSDAHRPARR